MTCPNGQVKLIDFGQTCKNGTVKEHVQGTPDFIAPEQVRLKPIDFRTDVFSYGATLYWALCGQKIPTLYTVDKSERRELKHQNYPSPREINPNVPEPLSKLAMWCATFSIGGRPKDMATVVTGLQKITEVLTIIAPPSVSLEAPRRFLHLRLNDPFVPSRFPSNDLALGPTKA